MFDIKFSGGGFDGPNCKKILDNLDAIPGCPSAIPVIDALNAFKGLSESCFSFSLSPDFETKIEKFKICILHLKEILPAHNQTLKISWKLHIVLYHLKPFCQKKKTGLAAFAEQAIESVHSKFTPTWKRYKVSKQHSMNGVSLKRAVVAFSAVRR